MNEDELNEIKKSKNEEKQQMKQKKKEEEEKKDQKFSLIKPSFKEELKGKGKGKKTATTGNKKATTSVVQK